MKDIITAALVLLSSGFVVFICGVWAYTQRQRGERLGIGEWFVFTTIGVPAAIVFAATLLGIT